jgi:hypothetical protein
VKVGQPEGQKSGEREEGEVLSCGQGPDQSDSEVEG